MNIVAILTFAAALSAAPVENEKVEPGPAAVPKGHSEPLNIRASRALANGRYLEAIDLLKTEPNDPASATMLSQFEHFITGMPQRRRGSDAADVDAATLRAFEVAGRRDAVAEIVARARTTRVVILNEAHDNPQHRAFGLEVARALRPLGYSVLALETYANHADEKVAARSMEALAERGYPTMHTGSYTSEPMFGDFVRQTLALGYRPVAYEQTSPAAGGRKEQIAAREEEQAEYLMSRIFSGDPEARALIFVGYSHAAEARLPIGQEGTIEWMAARLKKKSGIDPLTVDQTTISEFADSPASRLLHEAVSDRIGSKPAVFVSDAGAVLRTGRYEHAVDLQVAHPRMRLIAGRPDWLHRIGRRPLGIPEYLLPTSGRRLVQAFVAGEGDGAVPVDQIIVEPGEAPVLMVPDAVVRLAIQDPTP